MGRITKPKISITLILTQTLIRLLINQNENGQDHKEAIEFYQKQLHSPSPLSGDKGNHGRVSVRDWITFHKVDLALTPTLTLALTLAPTLTIRECPFNPNCGHVISSRG